MIGIGKINRHLFTFASHVPFGKKKKKTAAESSTALDRYDPRLCAPEKIVSASCCFVFSTGECPSGLRNHQLKDCQEFYLHGVVDLFVFKSFFKTDPYCFFSLPKNSLFLGLVRNQNKSQKRRRRRRWSSSL